MHAFLDWEKSPLAIIAEEGALCVVPAKSNARNPEPHDANLYAMRNIVERFFCKMKDMRRLATRFEKYAQNFLAMLHIFAIKCWINWVHTLVLNIEMAHLCTDEQRK